MSNLFFRYTLVLALSVGLAAVFYYRQYRPPVPSAQISNLDYAVHSREANDLLFMGSSRAVRHFSPAVFDSVLGLRSYNLGSDQTGIIEAKMIFRRYLQSHPAPRYVVLSIDVSRFMFNTRSAGPYNLDEYFPYLRDTLIYKELARYNWRYRFYPLTQYFYALYPIQKMMAQSDRDKRAALVAGRQRVGTDSTAYHNRGFLPVNESWDEADERELREQRARPVRAETTEEGFQLLDEFCQLAKKEGIRVIFVNPPLYYEVRLPDNQAEVLDRVKQTAAKFGIPYLDYADYPLARQKTNFYDCWHFNGQAARVFSATVARDLKNYLH